MAPRDPLLCRFAALADFEDLAGVFGSRRRHARYFRRFFAHVSRLRLSRLTLAAEAESRNNTLLSHDVLHADFYHSENN